MIALTWGQIKADIARVAGVSGMSATDTRTRDRFNQATLELMNEGDWPGVVDRYLFKINDGNIILPSFLDRAMGIAINTIPYEMTSPWYEFMEYGPGIDGGYGWVDTVIDRGELPIQYAIPAGTSYELFTVGEVDERVSGERPFLTIRGRLANGRNVRSFYAGTGYIDGERIFINGDTPDYIANGTALFAEVTSVTKPLTNGYVELWGRDATNDIKFATYGPNDRTASFHAYYLPTLKTEDESGIQTVIVRGRKRYYEVRSDDDPVIISNVQAMKSMVMAIGKLETSEYDQYAALKATAMGILKKEAQAYRGITRKPVISVQSGFSIGDIPYLR